MIVRMNDNGHSAVVSATAEEKSAPEVLGARLEKLLRSIVGAIKAFNIVAVEGDDIVVSW